MCHDIFEYDVMFFRKQPSRGVIKKRCSKSMRQFYKRIPMPNSDFNEVTKQLYEITIAKGVLL